MKEIIYYTTRDNRCPYVEWRDSLDKTMQIRVFKRINRMQDGNFGDWKYLQNANICEMRLHFGKGYRIYFKELDNVIVLILAGSSKSDQKAAIKEADGYLADYIAQEKEKQNGNKI